MLLYERNWLSKRKLLGVNTIGMSKIITNIVTRSTCMAVDCMVYMYVNLAVWSEQFEV